MGQNCTKQDPLTLEEYIARSKNMRINTVGDYHDARIIMNTIGLDKLYHHLASEGYVEDGLLTPYKGPMNVFAKYAFDLIPNPVPQHALLNHQNEFVIVHNRKSEDDNWNNVDAKGGSMAGPDDNGPGHVFMTTTNLDWHLFNVLSFGMKQTDLELLERMKEAATMYATSRGWRRVGFYFHCFPLNSVQSLHLHIVNLDKVGVHFYRQQKKNLPLDAVIIELKNCV